MSKQRITIETLASGQPRPYADSRLHVRVTFEVLRDWGKPEERDRWFRHGGWTNEDVRKVLREAKCGFTDKEPEHWSSDRLASLEETSPGVWEFVVISPFTD